MMRGSLSAGSAGERWRPQGAWAALLTFAVGAAVPFLRPALPLDEMRYLEVLREMERGGPWLLRCNGVPYADKPPLLFWCARLLELAGLTPELALRLLPALASAGLVLVIERLGRRLALPRSGWLQAALLLPFVYAQVLLFDPLLSFCIWLALAAWAAGEDRRALVAASLAFLAKGPIAALFLVPFAVALAPARPRPEHTARRLAFLMLRALVPLCLWALIAAHLGGDAFARELLWHQTAGRVSDAFAHRRPFWFYLPLVVAGFLPALPLLFVRGGAVRPRAIVRLGPALATALVLLMLLSGKQAHYLLPLAPAAALLAASGLQNARTGERWLRRAATFELALLAVACGALLFWRAPLLGCYEAYGEALARSRPWFSAVAAGALLAAALAAVVAWRRTGATATLALLCVGRGLVFAPIHVAAGALLLPRAVVAETDRAPATPLLLYKLANPGIYAWATRRLPLDTADTPQELATWVRTHDRGMILLERRRLPEAGSLVPVAWDRMLDARLVLLRTATTAAR